MIKGAIFDVDGTLLDTMDIWSKADEIYLSQKGFKATNELSKLFSTLTMQKSLEYMKNHFHIDDSIDQMLHDILTIVQEFYLHKVTLKPYFHEILDFFENHHIPMIIATSNQKNLIEQTLQRLQINKKFINILTSDEIGSNKSDPAIFYKACYYLNSYPSETLVFEDSLHAIKTAYNHHFQVVSIYDDFSKNEVELIKENSHFHLHFNKDYEDFFTYLNQSLEKR